MTDKREGGQAFPRKVSKGACLVFAIGLLAVVSWGPVSAFGQASGFYSRTSSACAGSISDPIGILFAGNHASVENVSKDIILHGNWPYRGVGVGEQYANVYRQTSALQCESNSEGMASQGFGDFGLDRFHIRLWLTWQSGGKPKTVGTPHWERVVRCGTFSVGHAVLGYGTIPGSPGESGFEAAKHKLKQNFRDSGHKVGALQWGNDLAVEQCNGWIAANGDGYVALVYTNHLIP